MDDAPITVGCFALFVSSITRLPFFQYPYILSCRSAISKISVGSAAYLEGRVTTFEANRNDAGARVAR